MKIYKDKFSYFLNTYVIFFSLFAGLYYVSIFYLNRAGCPYCPLWRPELRLGDLLEGYSYIVNGNPYLNSSAETVANYPPFGYLFYEILKFLKINKLQNLVLLYIFILLPVFFIFKKKFDSSENLFILFFLIFFNYPYAFSLERGNLEIFVSLFLFISFFLKNNFYKSIFISLAASLKLTPLIFLLVFLNKKNFKYFLIGLFNFLILNIFSFSFFKGNNFEETKIFIYNVVNWVNMKNSTGDATVDLWDPISNIYYYYTDFEVPNFFIKSYQMFFIIILLRIMFLILKNFEGIEYNYTVISIFYFLVPSKSYIYKYTLIFIVIIYFLITSAKFSEYFLFLITFTLFPLDFAGFYGGWHEYNTITTPIINLIILLYLLFIKTPDKTRVDY